MNEKEHVWYEPIPCSLVFIWHCQRCGYAISGIEDPNLQVRKPEGYECDMRVVRQVMES